MVSEQPGTGWGDAPPAGLVQADAKRHKAAGIFQARAALVFDYNKQSSPILCNERWVGADPGLLAVSPQVT